MVSEKVQKEDSIAKSVKAETLGSDTSGHPLALLFTIWVTLGRLLNPLCISCFAEIHSRD